MDDCRRVGVEERSGADVWKAVAVATTAASSVASRRRRWIIIIIVGSAALLMLGVINEFSKLW